MSQGEISISAEANEDNEFISVRRWVDPDHSETGEVDRDQPRVLLARSLVTFIRVEGHHLYLHTITGDIYVRRGTLKDLHERWAKYGFVRPHNSFVVFLPHVRQLRRESDGPVVYVGSGAGAALLPVSRRKFHEIKQQLEGQGDEPYPIR
jgi:DNA-binding LytR/AlgR family response regulator